MKHKPLRPQQPHRPQPQHSQVQQQPAQQRQQKVMLSILSLSVIAAMSHAHALQPMSDQDLRAINGQDGISMNIGYSEVKIDEVAWVDQAGKASGDGEQALKAGLGNVQISRGALPSDQKLGADVKFDVYSSTTQGKSTAGINLNVASTLGKLTTDSVKICPVGQCSERDPSMGGLRVESYDPIHFNLLTTNGLFNQDSKAYFDLSIKNMQLGLAQKDQAGKENILAMKDLNINLKTLSYMYIDPVNGFSLKSGSDGFADFIRDEITGKPGLNFELTVNDRGLLRAGASGRMINGLVQFGSAGGADLLGNANLKNGNSVQQSNNAIAGSTGIRFKIAGEFTNDSDKLGSNATSLELGGAGGFSYGIRFENITALRTRTGIKGDERGDVALTTERAGLAMDGIYVNLVDSQQIKLPVNPALTQTFLGTNKGAGAVPIATDADFVQTIANTSSVNPYSAVISLRNVDYMALSRRGQFIASKDVTDPNKLPSATPAKWGLGLPIHNLNGNIALYAKKSDGVNDMVVSKNAQGVPVLTPVSGSERIGFSASISTQGVSQDGSKSTSILLIDGADNSNYANGMVTPTDYYIGLRNIDMLLNGYGSMGFENGQVNVSMPNLKMIMAAQIAAGYLPGAKYKSCPTTGGCYAPSDNFNKPYDVLAAVKVRLAGSMNFALIPRAAITDQKDLVDGVNALNIVGVMQLDASKKMNNAIQIVDTDGSTLGLDNLSGTIGFDNNLIVNKDNVGFHYSFLFNPNKTVDGVFRAKDVNLYPATVDSNKLISVGNPQRLGELAITGGRLDTQLSITPRDTPFKF